MDVAWRVNGVTAFVALVPVCVSMLVASWTAPTLVVVELVIEITEPSKVVVATIGAIAVTGGGACHTKLPDPSV
jgi:hypothetical protein